MREQPPDRPLSPEEKSAAMASAKKEWKKLSEEEGGADVKAHWGKLNFAKKVEKVTAAEEPQEDKPPFVGLWGASCMCCMPLGIDALLNQNVGKNKPLSMPHLFDKEQVIGGPAAPAKHRVAGHGESSIAVCLGCHAQKRNICRVHGKWSIPSNLGALTSLTDLLSDWVDTLPKEEAKGCMKWLRLRNAWTPDSDDECDETTSAMLDMSTIVLLIHPTYSPKMQWYLRLTHEGSTCFPWPELPFTVFGKIGDSRMGGSWVTSRVETSDEVAVDALDYFHEWKASELQWADPVNAYPSTLLAFSILGEGEDVKPKVRQHRPHLAYTLPGVLGQSGDPFARPAPAPPEADPAASSFMGGPAPEGPAEADDEDAYDLLPPDVVAELADDFIDEEDDPPLDLEPPEWDPPEMDIDEDSVGDLFYGDDDIEEPESPKDKEETPMPTPSEATAAARITPLAGYIACDLEPWASMPAIARMSTWPDHLPMDQRVVSLRCMYHSSCHIMAQRRSQSDDKLLEWVFSGEIQSEGVNAATRRDLGKKHMELWKAMK